MLDFSSSSAFSDRKITEPVARKILGRDADTYSEKELTDIVDRLYVIAEYGLRRLQEGEQI